MGRLESAALTFLFNSLWQAPLLAGAALLVAWPLKRASAAHRHRVWLSALAFVVLVPMASALKVLPTRPQAGRSPDTVPRVEDGGALSLAAAKRLGLDEEAIGLAGTARTVSLLYGLFLVLQSVRLASGWRRSAALVARGEEPPASLFPLLAECASALGRRVPVLLSSEVRVPMTFGLAAPVVLLPRWLVERATRSDLQGVLAHELGHVLRKDCAVNLLCEIAALPLSFHPVVDFLKRRIGGAREAACDEAAAAFVGPRVYARTLLDVAAQACPPSRLSGALGVLDGDSLEDRMKTILEIRNPMSGRAARGLLAVGLLGLGFTARAASDAALTLAAVAGPGDMIGRWTGQVGEGAFVGQPAADLAIALGPEGPSVRLTLYRYEPGASPGKAGQAEFLPVIKHRVEAGVLHFRTRVTDFRLRAEDPPSTTETEWQFAIVGKDKGELTVLSNSKLEADKAAGKAVPPPPPPLEMIRTTATP